MNSFVRGLSLAVSLVLCGCASTQSGSKESAAVDLQNAAHAKALNPAAKNVGIVVFDDVFITEFVAPLDVYKHTGDKMNVFTVGPKRADLHTYEGVVFRPDYSFADAPKIDVLVVPSGNG